MDTTARIARWVTFRYTSVAGSLPRRLRFHVMAVCFAVGILGGCSGRQSETAVLAPVQAMFDGMAHRDAAAIKASWVPGSVLVVAVEGNLRQITVENFANRVATWEPRTSRNGSTIRRSGSTTIWRSSGLPSTSSSMANSIIAAEISSASIKRTADGRSSRSLPPPVGTAPRTNLYLTKACY